MRSDALEKNMSDFKSVLKRHAGLEHFNPENIRSIVLRWIE
jgi:hypothetical protein